MMAKLIKVATKRVIVREHPRSVKVSQKNPLGKTVVDKHIRNVAGKTLGVEKILEIRKNYSIKKVIFPASKKLKYPDSDKYDGTIAIWVDYFNKEFKIDPIIDPDVVKALIGSESGFRSNPPENKTAFGIVQITKSTLKILLDKKGEAKTFYFKGVTQKKLLDPEVNIALAVRWLAYKQERAKKKLGRNPTAEEVILEYKGLLKSKTEYKQKALNKFRTDYEALKK